MSANLSELALIGACMADDKAYWQVADLVDMRDFADSGCGRLFADIGRRSNEGEATDAVSLAEAHPELGALIFDQAMAEGWRISAVRHYATMVRKNAVARRVRRAAQQIAHLDGDDVLGEAQRLLGACAPHISGGMRHVREFAREAFVMLEGRLSATSEMTGVPTGLPDLDKVTGGLQPSNLVVLAAEPGVGKTALALQIARATAKHEKQAGSGKHVGIFSLEMAGAELSDRLIAAEGRFNGKLLRTPKLMAETDWPHWSLGNTIISDLPLLIDDQADITIEILCARIRQCHAVTPFSLVVVDYLQLINLPKADRHDIALGLVTRALKILAKELGITVLLLSQLNKDFKDRPTLRNLRGSGAIGQDADLVMILYLPDEATPDYVELLLPKHRNGERVDFALEFIGQYQTFHSATTRPASVKNSRARTAEHYWNEMEGESF